MLGNSSGELRCCSWMLGNGSGELRCCSWILGNSSGEVWHVLSVSSVREAVAVAEEASDETRRNESQERRAKRESAHGPLCGDATLQAKIFAPFRELRYGDRLAAALRSHLQKPVEFARRISSGQPIGPKCVRTTFVPRFV